MSEIQVKVVKIAESGDTALVKSKWTDTTINFEILAREKHCEFNFFVLNFFLN